MCRSGGKLGVDRDSKEPSPREQSEPIHSNHCFKGRAAKLPRRQSMSETSWLACRVARGLIVGITLRTGNGAHGMLHGRT